MRMPPAQLAQVYDPLMVQTRRTGRATEIIEVRPMNCVRCLSRKIWPRWGQCSQRSPSGPGHRFWECMECHLDMIDADCKCDPAENPQAVRWPVPQIG